MAVIEPSDKILSVHQPIIYTRTFIDVPFTGISVLPTSLYGYDAVMLLMSTANAANFVANQRLYIGSGLYAGNYTVLASTTTGVQIATANLGAATGFAKPLNSETVTINAGYPSTHPAYLVYPYGQIAQFTAIPGVTGTTQIDVSTFLKSVFKKISAPVSGRDYELMLPFDVVLSGYTSSVQFNCMNATVDHSALFQRAVPIVGPAAMQYGEPIHFDDGVVMYTIITSDGLVGYYPINVFGIDGIGNPGGLGFDEVGSTFIIG